MIVGEMRRWLPLVAAVAITAACAAEPVAPSAAPEVVRVALFNIRELSTTKLAAVDDTGVGNDPQVRAAATIVQEVRPDVLVVQEIDHDHDVLDEDGLAHTARRFADAYLATGDAPLHFEHVWAGPSNTGILSGVDLDGDGHVATDADRGERVHGNDSFGYGEYPGQYSMAVLSRYPIDEDAVRTFREFLWRDLPGNHIPEGYHSPEALAVFRLSSKSHQDVPLRVAGRSLHLLVSHPTPPVFDGDEDHNGRRNWDEIRLWAEYLDGASWLVDDRGRAGGLAADAPFVIVGDLNARPDDTESVYEGIPAIRQLLAHPRVQDPPQLVSPGAPPEVPGATTAFGGRGARIDYVLPSTDLEVVDGGVHWPADPEGAARALAASDHRLVWLDLRLPSHPGGR